MIFSLVSAVASTVTAADKAGFATETAKAHYKQGRMHYQLGEYREALREFKEAYRLKQDASFLYNIAQCHRQLGEYSDAIKLYGSYLREASGAANRAEVERQITEMKAAVEKQQREAQASAPPPAPASPEPTRPLAPAAFAPDTTSAPIAGPAGGAAVPAPASLSVAAFPRNSDSARDAELDVFSDPAEANILVNHISVARRGPAKVRLPPGLYSVALEREGFRGAEGAITLVAGDHTTLTGTLIETKTHGWRTVGYVLLGLTVLSEAGAWYPHYKANSSLKGSDDFNTYSTLEKCAQGVAISSAVLAITSFVVDWLVNRDKADPGPPAPLQRVSTETQ